MISYEPLWETLKNKKITKYALVKKLGVSHSTLYRINEGKSISLKTLDELCNILDCDITDIIKYTKSTDIQLGIDIDQNKPIIKTQ